METELEQLADDWQINPEQTWPWEEDDDYWEPNPNPRPKRKDWRIWRANPEKENGTRGWVKAPDGYRWNYFPQL